MTRLGKAIILGLLTGLLGIGVSLSHFGMDLEENFGLGFLFDLRGKRQPPSDVVVISLDRQSADHFNLPRDPRKWPRSYHARLVEKLSQEGASVIVFDLVFKDEERDDDVFAKAIRKAGNVVLAEYIEKETIPIKNQSGRVTGEIAFERLVPPIPALEQEAILAAAFPLPKVPVRVSQYWTFKDGSGDTPTSPVAVLQIFASPVFDDFSELLKKTLKDPKLALVSQDPKNQAALRAALRVINLQNQEIVVSKKVDEVILSMKEILGNETFFFERMMKEFESPKGRYAEIIKNDLLRALLKAYSLNSHYLNFYGPPHTITTVPYFEVLQWGPKAAINANPVDFKGKAVFIGISEFLSSEQKDGFHTVFTQPNGLYLSGVEICATAFANLLEDFHVRPLDLPVHLFMILLWGIAIGMVWLLLPPVIAMGISAAFILFMVGSAYTQFKMAGLWFPLITPIVFQTPFASFGAVLWNYIESNRERRIIKEAFGYYLPDTVVDQLSRGLKGLKSGGQLVYGSCLITDVENYTALSESMSPADLKTLMNDYYEGIFAPVKQYGGTPLGVKGDSSLAIWASPDPDARLRVQACLAALEIARAVDRFNQSPGGPKLQTRIGLHSGQMLLGNVGGGHHLEYTAMGDMVNTASRIEGLNKYLGTRLLTSQETLADLGDFLTRDLGTFLLAGKFRPVEVRELIAQLKESDENQRKLCRDFSTALQLYKMRLWPEAIDVFSKILSENAADGPSLLYIKHCEQLMQSHPSDSWDGIIRMDQK